MNRPGTLRERLIERLNAAYAGGLISDQTLVARLDVVLGRRLVDSEQLIGDLWLRERRSGVQSRIHQARSVVRTTLDAAFPGRPADAESFGRLLALEWEPGSQALLIGRSSRCDVVLGDDSVSRQHARLSQRGAGWVIQDLESTNGSFLNGRRIGRCELRPGDRLVLGNTHLRVD